MLVNLKEILELAEKQGRAIPAFNVYNMETVMGVIAAAKEMQAPIILQAYSRLFSNEEAYYLAPTILAASQSVNTPVCFQLDHGAGEREVIRAIRYGCTGIMYDASVMPLDDNIACTKDIVEKCTYAGVPVEGELGHIGSTGDNSMDEFTCSIEAGKYVEKTGVSALAVLVGTAHGRYKKPPKLDIDRIAEIRRITGIPLVLHGGSGVPDIEIKAAIEAGIRKINFATDLCYCFIDKIFETSRDTIAIDLFMKDAIANVKQFAISKIKLLGADGIA